ncbi:putative histone-fold containing protein [Erysiphe neolycopersici]|uniref:Putative histone-fold containing protein n=1 Tax=Erysiphe neolycopersici TaxID=212602 RepID=A0A420HWG4_9PEZI|nr:putative histone-fold containing protein [Erysiphe neolycopersici]
MSQTSSQAKKLRRNPALIQLASRQANVISDNSLEDLVSNETREEQTPKQVLTKATPIYRAPKIDATSNLRSARRSLKYNTRSPSTSQKQGSIKGSISLTPHGRAAQRELHLRTGLTPAGSRRKSGRNQQRETPRDDLRALSRLLAAKSPLIVPKPELSTPLNNNDEEEDESDLIRPRLSLALNPDDEVDSFLLPPESTGLQDENITVKSIELARRAVDELPYSKISRGSFGSIRMSNNVFSNLNEEGMKGDVDNSSYLVDFRKDDPTMLSNIDNDNDLHFDDTGIFKFAIPERDRLSQNDRDSGMQRNNLVTEDNDTFF